MPFGPLYFGKVPVCLLQCNPALPLTQPTVAVNKRVDYETHRTHYMTATTPIILVAEDHPEIRMLIGTVLQNDGYTVVMAENGLEALQRALQINPALVIIDGQMPVLNGWDASRQIHTSRPHIPILMLTVHTEPHDYERSAASGVTAYMSKPFDPDALLQEVSRLVTPA